MKRSRLKSSYRKIKATWRDTLLLLQEFSQPLLLFVTAVVGFGILYYYLSQNTTSPTGSISESIYTVLLLTFLQSPNAYPQEWYRQIFYFAMPVAGVGILAQGLTDFGVLLFNRRARRKEWEVAVASTFNNHVVLVGLGHLGYRVVQQLHDMDKEVVVIERDPNKDLLENIRALGIPIIPDDASREATLKSSGIRKADAIVLCTQNDILNLQIALKARSINPNIHVIIRIFDDDFALMLETQFGFHAFTATGIAAPTFAGYAAHAEITPPITINGDPLSMARITITPSSDLIGLTVGNLEEKYHMKVILLDHDGNSIFHPRDDMEISNKDDLLFLGAPENITALVHQNH